MLKLSSRAKGKLKLRPKIKKLFNMRCIYGDNEYEMKFRKQSNIKTTDVLKTFCKDQLKSKKQFHELELVYDSYILRPNSHPERIMTNKDIFFQIKDQDIKESGFPVGTEATVNDAVKRHLFHYMIKAWNNVDDRFNILDKIKEFKCRDLNLKPLFDRYPNLPNNKDHLRLAINQFLEGVIDIHPHLIIDNNYLIKPFDRQSRKPDLVLRSKDESFVMPITLKTTKVMKKRYVPIHDDTRNKKGISSIFI